MTRHVPHVNRKRRDTELVEVKHVCKHTVKRLVFIAAKERMVKKYEQENCPDCYKMNDAEDAPVFHSPTGEQLERETKY